MIGGIIGTDIKFLVIVGILVMLLLMVSFLVILVVHQRKKLRFQNDMQDLREQQKNQLIEAAVKSEEGERHRIAEQLHDEVGAILSSTRLHFSNIKDDSLDSGDKQLYEKSKLLLNDAIQQVRSISHNLHSTLLKEFGLNEAIRNFADKTVKSDLVTVEVNLDETYIIQNQQMDIGIYRIFQELLNNILKHAKANYVRITTECIEDLYYLRIIYNGIGLSQEQFEELRYKREGLGLKNIMNRIILLKGSILYEQSDMNNSILLTIPLVKEL
jgi:two-component system NarL family sensor kinase